MARQPAAAAGDSGGVRPVRTAHATPPGGERLGLLRQLKEDLDVVVARDPSRRDRWEAALHAPWQALAVYRLAHRLHGRGHRVTALSLTWLGRVISGMELSPGARLGRRVFIDHGFGVVVGEGTVIGDDVTLYHKVTLGSRGWWQASGPPARRHPVIGARVRVGVGASVLGPVVVGDDCLIRAHELVLTDREHP
ncbi:serine acetyltransferase [Actinosynnema sp. ALI-1.44]|nr:serine acetyltransferase [Actinosynnema sp. ALI-1.44]